MHNIDILHKIFILQNCIHYKFLNNIIAQFVKLWLFFYIINIFEYENVEHTFHSCRP